MPVIMTQFVREGIWSSFDQDCIMFLTFPAWIADAQVHRHSEISHNEEEVRG
jgi:hypothetical protein